MRRSWHLGLASLVVATLVGVGVSAFQIDPAVVARVAVPTNGIWIPSSSTGEIVHIDTHTAAVSIRVPVAEAGAELDVAETAAGVVVVDRTDGIVSLVDPALHEVVRTVTLTSSGLEQVDIGPEAIVVVSDSEVTMVDADVTESASTGVSGEVRSVAAHGAGGVVATATEFVPFDLDISTAAAGTATTDDDTRLVRAGDRLFEVDRRGVGVFGSGVRECPGRTFGPDVQAVGSSSGGVVTIDQGILRLADLDADVCHAVQFGDAEVATGPATVAGDLVFVPEPALGVVHIIDPLARTAISPRVPFAVDDLLVQSRGEIVVAYSLKSSFATLLGQDGTTRTFDTAANDLARGVVLGGGDSSALIGGESESLAVGLDGVEGAASAAAADLLVVDAEVLGDVQENPEVTEPTPEPVVVATPDELVAAYAVSAATVLVGTEVRFVDESIGDPQSWVWDFGDGSGAEGPQVGHSWASPGTFAVTLFITRGDDVAEVTRLITVVPADSRLPPSADFILSAAIVEVGDPVSLEDRSRGDIDRWHWDFGDGTSATARNVVKSWDRAGRYTVTLTVANAEGSDSARIAVEVREGLRAPVVVVEASAERAEAGEPVVFKAASTTDPAVFTWDFGDGRAATGAEVTQVFLTEGSYAVTVLASNDAGTSEATVVVTIVPPTLVPVARIAALPDIIEVGDVVALASLSTNSPDTEVWSFGDGGSAEGSAVDYSWTTPGTFLVSLTATNRAGSSVFRVPVVVVPELPAPLAVISGFEVSPWIGDPTSFTESSLDATGWLWDFGDGGISTSPNPIHTFLSTGQKTVTLTVTNRNGSDTTSVTVEPRLKPSASFTQSTTAPRVGEFVVFTDLSVNAATWSWDFGDGSTSADQNPQHAYSAAGSYDVVLTISSATGDPDSFGPITVNVDPAAPVLSGVATLGIATTLESTTLSAAVAANSGPINTYEIDFGDTSPTVQAASAAFTHTYSAAGSYVVRMRAQGPLLDWSPWVEATQVVTDPLPPLIGISASVPLSAPLGFVSLAGDVLVGSGPINSWDWEITGTGGTVALSGQSVVHNFLDPGTYQLTLRAVGPVVEVTTSQSITIDPPPPPVISALIATPAVVTTGAPVQFVPTITGSAVQWEWNYDGGGYVVSVVGVPGEYIFNTAGPHVVWLKVTGPYGGTHELAVAITAHATPSPATPVASPVQATYTTGDTVGFTSSETGGASVSTWDWTLDNGVDAPVSYPNAGPSINHTFLTAGSWTVTVTAVGPSGAQASSSSSVTVVAPVPPLVANFTHVVGSLLDVTFTDTSTGPPIDTWSWNFGDGSLLSPVQSPVHTYAAAGSYTVELTVTSGLETRVHSVVITVP